VAHQAHGTRRQAGESGRHDTLTRKRCPHARHVTTRGTDAIGGRLIVTLYPPAVTAAS